MQYRSFGDGTVEIVKILGPLDNAAGEGTRDFLFPLEASMYRQRKRSSRWVFVAT